MIFATDRNVRVALAGLFLQTAAWSQSPEPSGRRLHGAAPGIRDDLDRVRRSWTPRRDPRPSARTKRVYISTTKQLMCLDLVTEKLLW
jgi:hypothetical protein